MGLGIHRVTILPRSMEYFIDRHIESKKLRMINKLLIFAAVCLLLYMVKTASASITSFFGYDKDTEGTFASILSGIYARRTLAQCFSRSIMDSVTGNSIITTISNVVSGIGILICFINTMAKTIEYAQTGMITEERLASVLIQFSVPILLILNISLLTDAVTVFGEFTMDTVRKAATGRTGDEWAGDAIDAVNDAAESYPVYEHVFNIILNVKVSDDAEDDPNKQTYLDKQLDGYDQYMEDCNNADNAGDYLSASASYLWGTVKNTFASIGSFFSDSGNSFLESCRLMLANGIMSIITLLLMIMDMGVRISITIACYGIYGRLMLYQAFLPIGISDIGIEGTRSNGMRVIKMYFEVYLEIGMYFAVNEIFWSIFNTMALATTTLAGVIVCFMSVGAGIKASFKGARSVSETMLGAR